MNSRGVYTALIAIAALSMIVSSFFISGADYRADRGKIYLREVAEAKREWQNARIVLDKALSDALADSSYSNSCRFSQKHVASYFSTVENSLSDCKITMLSSNGQANDFTVTVSIECVKKFGKELNVEYKKSAGFSKSVVTKINSAVTPETCTVTVTDLQSGFQEVSQTQEM